MLSSSCVQPSMIAVTSCLDLHLQTVGLPLLRCPRCWITSFKISEVFVLYDRQESITWNLRHFEQVFLIWLPASRAAPLVPGLLSKKSATELRWGGLRMSSGSWAGGSVLLVPYRDCLLFYGPKGKSLASSEAQLALGLQCVFRGMLLVSLNALWKFGFRASVFAEELGLITIMLLCWDMHSNHL